VVAVLLTRADDPDHRQKARYSLTESAIELVPLLAQMGRGGAATRRRRASCASARKSSMRGGRNSPHRINRALPPLHSRVRQCWIARFREHAAYSGGRSADMRKETPNISGFRYIATQ
jgi:hypothetical protein